MLDRTMVRCLGCEIDQVDILRGVALGEFCSDELVLLSRDVIPRNHDPFVWVYSYVGLEGFKEGESILPLQAQGSAFTGVLVQDPEKRLRLLLPFHLKYRFCLLSCLLPVPSLSNDCFLIDPYLIGGNTNLSGSTNGVLSPPGTCATRTAIPFPSALLRSNVSGLWNERPDLCSDYPDESGIPNPCRLQCPVEVVGFSRSCWVHSSG